MHTVNSVATWRISRDVTLRVRVGGGVWTGISSFGCNSSKSDLGSADPCWWHQGSVNIPGPNTRNAESLGLPKFKGSLSAHSAAHSDAAILILLQKTLQVVHELATSDGDWDWDGDGDWDWDWDGDGDWDWDWDWDWNWDLDRDWDWDWNWDAPWPLRLYLQ